jgi:SAF domain-containing protein
MSTIAPPPAGPRLAADERPVTRVRGGPRRRSVPHLLLGVLLVTACTAGAVVWSLNIGERRPALALARPVVAGQTIAPADLREVDVAVDGEVDAIPASEAQSVVGRTAAASLPAGILLPRGALGVALVPDGDHAVAALALQPGQVPPGVDAGSAVLVVLSADPNSTTSGAAPAGSGEPISVWRGVVVDVSRGANDQRLVVSVELTESDARRVAATPVGQLSVVLVSGGGR